jgi:DNA polymerase-3 subunit alpha
MIMAGNYVHLHAHSEYSLLDGSIKVERLVARAKELGMPAVALTDHGNLFGMIHFYRAARAAGVKPILGMEAYITRGSRRDRSRKLGELSQTDHLILLARNLEGYRNLVRLSSIAYTEGFYYKPRIDFEVLEQFSGGLIATTSCLRGTVAQMALNNGYEEARKAAERYRSIFGADNYYIEMQDHGLEPQKQLNGIYRKMGKEMGIPLIASNDVHYLDKEDADAHEVLLCLQTGSDLEDPRRFRFASKELYLKTEDEMLEVFPDDPEALENTLAVAEKCDVALDEGNLHLPKYPLPEGFERHIDYLRHLAHEGLNKRYAGPGVEIKDRLEYELGVIEGMDFPGYFLIVRDIVNHAKEQGIPVGPGRGSAAGSLVTYAVGITDVDPIEHGLLFERMLNPERVSMPDIDIDFCFERRDEVINYVIDRYGKDNVCQIITFGTMAARGVVRDVGRVLKIPYADVDRIAKMIPGVPGTTLKESLEKVQELKALVESSEEYQRLMNHSLTLEGLARHASTHAAGMIITPTPLVNHVPLYRSNKGEITSQYDMKSIDAIGLLKIDVLGLRTLTVIDKALKMIADNFGVEIKPEEIPINDEKTFDLLRAGATTAVFQLESAGMKELLRNLQPTAFSDIIAVNALYRPGPLQAGMVNHFVDCKHGRKKIKYENPVLEPILSDTYGVILYQEQVMQIASNMARFTLGEADLLRKAMGKKQKDVMEGQKKKFLEGAVANKIPKHTAQAIWDQMESFAQYGFNKSHSVAYAVISARTAYLKANYPAEFMAATLTSEMDDTDRILVLLEDCRDLGLKIVPPNINSSEAEFRAKDGCIFYGLGAIKNVGLGAVEHIVEERENGGPFRSLENLCTRVNSRVVNRRVYESLIQSGALDSLPGHRAQKMNSLERIMERAARRSRDAERGQFGLFGEVEENDEVVLGECDPWSARDELRREKEALGFFLTGHPLERYKNLLSMMSSATSKDIKSSANGKDAVFGGLVINVKQILDRKQNPMAFVTIEDKEGQAEAILFSDVLEKARRHVQEDGVVLLKGKTSNRNGGEGKLLVDAVTPVSEEHFPNSKEVHCTLDMESLGEEKVDELKNLLASHAGEAKVYFHLKEGGRCTHVIAARSMGVKLDYDLVSQLSAAVGPDNIRLIPSSGP